MSTYNLSQTAAEIDSAIGKVHNADTAPTQGSTSMVTSGGVYTAVNDIGVSALPITTEAQGIANYDNDDKVPTNAAVKDYVDSSSQDFAIFSASNRTSSSLSYGSGISINGTVVAGSFASLSGGSVTLGAGTYEFGISGDFASDTDDDYDSWELWIRASNSIIGRTDLGDSGISNYRPKSATAFYSTNSNVTISAYVRKIGTAYLRYRNVRLFIRKVI